MYHGVMTCKDGQPSLQHKSGRGMCAVLKLSRRLLLGVTRLINGCTLTVRVSRAAPEEPQSSNVCLAGASVTNTAVKRSHRFEYGIFCKQASLSPEISGLLFIWPPNSSLQCRGHPLTFPDLQMLAATS